ncbi:cysteine desulfurase, partial [Acidocella sp.]|uniref:cysteine desulfurase n=1 Tax=Acidocella sp. TaxID=50710 RepID=UPI002F4085D8
ATSEYANVHRGVHHLSGKATDRYEAARRTVQKFLNAAHEDEIVFTKGTTESINLVAAGLGQSIRPGDEIIVSQMEHHANIVPWHFLRERQGAVLRFVPVREDGSLDLQAYFDLLGPRTRMVAITHMSNVLGTINPAKAIVEAAHAAGVPVLLDGAQAIVHKAVDVQDLDVDFYAFSGHKLFGPTGIGVLYGKAELLEAMPPFLGGGDMIASVSYAKSSWAKPPARFEAGTPAIIETIGLGAAIDYVQEIGFDAIAEHERVLTDHALSALSDIEGLRILGQAQDRGGVISFVMQDAHAHDIATLLDRQGIAVRAGHHCAEPLMGRLGVSSTARASFGLYTTPEEIDALAIGLNRIKQIFGR